MFQYISCYSLSKCPDSKCYSINVSIHLMLLFISLRPYRPSGRRRVSIHLMLLFINHQKARICHLIKFQYISCYSLSIPSSTEEVILMPFQYISCYSLSPIPIGKVLDICEFQYISCYSLSGIGMSGRIVSVEFQYISCYSLSRKQWQIMY